MKGILLIDKPSGWTSSDVVCKLRGMLHTKRVGHSGTLDPMATGLLVVFVGRATRAMQFTECHTKHYAASLRLGIETDTLDTTGTLVKSSPVNVTEEEFISVLDGFRGDISQIPPMYSAIKVKGQKLCDAARSGVELERKPRKVTISRLDYLGRDGEDYRLDVCCSKGTYIRTLCDDIGRALGCGGCMSALRRLESGNFSVDDAHSLDEVQEAVWAGEAEKLLLPVDCLFKDCPEYTVDEVRTRKIIHGNELKTELPDGDYRVYSQNGEFLMLGRTENGILRTVKSFFEVEEI
ncbi:MAG: tRNA pseudouridine(55) synthase TruB [Candidatus Limivicinus sp.]|jgi:tRNA pseudouridine55 synthase